MGYEIEALTGKLKAARVKKGWSQRSFAGSIGMPQSRLSKIENGLIDLRTSNLLELARSLDMELMMVPRQLVPAVDGLIRQDTGAGAEKETPMYRLDDEEDA